MRGNTYTVVKDGEVVTLSDENKNHERIQARCSEGITSSEACLWWLLKLEVEFFYNSGNDAKPVGLYNQTHGPHVEHKEI